MARLTGKNGKILAQTTRVSVSSPFTLTNSGDDLTYRWSGAPNQNYIDPTQPPRILINDVETFTGFTIQYAGDTYATITFTSSQAGNTIKADDYVYSTVAEIGSVLNWSVDSIVEKVDSTAMGDTWKEKLPTFKGWSGSAEAYYISSAWWLLYTAGQCIWVSLWPDKDAGDSERWLGAALIDWGNKVQKDAMVAQTVKFEGTNQLIRIGT